MPTVLVVDDAPDIRLLVRAVLSNAGFEVEEADSGEAALSRIDDGDLPDVVVLDVQMPGMDGWTALSRLRSHPRASHVPVMMSTVRASEADAARARGLGCDDYLVKPFSITDLVARVAALAAGRAPSTP